MTYEHPPNEKDIHDQAYDARDYAPSGHSSSDEFIARSLDFPLSSYADPNCRYGPDASDREQRKCEPERQAFAKRYLRFHFDLFVRGQHLLAAKGEPPACAGEPISSIMRLHLALRRRRSLVVAARSRNPDTTAFDCEQRQRAAYLIALRNSVTRV